MSNKEKRLKECHDLIFEACKISFELGRIPRVSTQEEEDKFHKLSDKYKSIHSIINILLFEIEDKK